MVDDTFEIRILDLHWIKNVDDPTDLCAHGHVYLKIGNKVVSDKATGDWTLSSTGLSLLRSIEKDYEKDDYSNQLLPCCGYFLIADGNQETVIIQGCDIGIDWKIIHTNDNRVRHIFDDGHEVTLNKESYRQIVFDFADEIEKFFSDSKPKTIPTDEFDRKGYLTFGRNGGIYGTNKDPPLVEAFPRTLHFKYMQDCVRRLLVAVYS